MAISSTEKAQLILDALHARDFILKPNQEANLIKQIEKLYAKGKTDDFIANKIAHKPFIKAQLNKLLKTDPTFKASIDTDHNGKISVAEKKAMFAGVTTELVNKIIDAVESQVTLTQDKTQITEGLDSVTYTLTGKPGTTLTWSVDSAHTDDVVAASGTVTLNASGTGTFSVTAKQDSLVEGAELASVTVKDVTGAVKATGQVTINDPAPSQVTLTQDQTEITEGQAPVNYTVTGVAGSTLTWSVDSAHAGDVLVASGAVTLNALGVGTFSITAKSDSLAEGPELATVTLKNSNGDVQATGQLTINDPPQTDLIPAEIFTLKEVIVPGTDPTPAQYQIYWGYNPHDHQGGWNQGNEAPSDGGIPVADLVNFLKTITGLDLQELGLIDADGQDPFQNVTSLSLSNPITASGSNPSNSGNGGNGGDGGNGGNGGLSGGGDGGEGGSSGGIDQSTYLRIDYADGTYLNAEVALGDAYFSFLSSLLFDNEGNSRLYEKVIEGTGSSGTEEHLAPILLTTQNNNGGTIETNVVTSPNDDLIVAGRLELLHQAYIDGGAGYNKLEVDAKGTYAQPAALLNIQEIRVNDLPNFYTTEYGSGEGNLDNTLYSNSGFLSPTDTGSDDSWLDLNRAIDLQKLVVTDGGYSGSGSYDGSSGNLTIVGVRNAATLRLEGSFKSGDTTIQYGLGQTGTLNIELALGEVTAPINILQNAPVLNIDSQGVENYMKKFFVGNSAGGSISRMYIKGTGVFGVDGDLHDSFYQGRPAIIDAHLNTGGLDITLNGHGNDVTVLGTSNNDEIEVSGANGIVTIDAGEGRNKIVAQNNPEVDITTGAGRDDIDASGSEVVTIDAGGGQNLIYANNSQEVTIEAGDGLNTIVVDQENGEYYGISDVSITTGGGNDNIEALRNGSVTIDAGNGNNTIVLSALQEVDITTGSGNDKVTVSGLNTTFDYGDLEEGGNGNNAGGFNGGNTDNSMLNAHFADNLAPGVVLNADLGAGQNTLTLGRDVQIGNSTVQFGVTALEGSSISGTGIKLFVENNSDLTQADLSGATITSVVLKQELRITSDQFAAIGADKFSVQYDEEGATEDLYIVVSHDTTLSDLVNLGALNPNVRLHFELRDGATLTLSAEELHDYVAVNGIYEDSGLSGKVVITDAAFNFNPFLSGPDYGVITGGTLAAGANGWENGQVTIIREADGFDRPVPTGYEDIYTIDSNTTPLVAANIVTEAQTLKIVGDADIKFTGVVDLGGELNIAGEDDTTYQHKGGIQDDNDNNPSTPPPTGESDNFVVDFSGLHGTLTGLTLDSFQDVKEIKGNGTGTRIDVILNADVGVLNAGLKTSGVAQYVVTQIDVDQDGKDDANSTLWFNLSDASQDVEVLGLNGNAGNTIVFTKVPWGLVHPSILLEGDGYADWNGGLKADGNPNASDIGTVRVEYFSPGAPAIVNINNGGVELGVTSTGGERYFDVDGIQLVNAASLNLNVTEGDAVIDSIVDASAPAQLKTLTVTATEDVTVNENLPAGLTAIDAAGVDGAFAVSVNRFGLDDQDFSFTGSAGGSTLTFTGDFTADDGSTDATTTAIDGGVGGVELVLKGTGVEVDLSDAALTHVTGVTLGQGTELSLTLDQADAIGAGNFALALGATSADLHLTGLAEQPFALSNYADGIDVSLVELADLPVITLNPATDLTGIGALRVHEGTVLNMTAAQFQQLNGNGTIWGVGNTKNFTVNITDLTQADIDPLDLNGDGDYNDAGEHNGLNLEQISANHVTVTLAENVELSATDSLATDVIGWPWFGSKTLDNTTVEIGGYTLTLADVTQADGLTVNGDAGGILKFFDTQVGPFESIDASHFNVETLQFLNVLAADRNVDLIFLGLPQGVEKVIYTGLGWVDGVNQTVTLEEGTTVPGFLVFNKPEAEVEIRNFTLNLSGGTEIEGSLRLSSSVKEDATGADLIQAHLQTVVINSTGTAENLLTGKAVNVIDGDITSQGMGPQGFPPIYNSVDNNLLNITINAEQDFTVKGKIIFESVTGDDSITANDDHEATATLNVNGTAAVNIGDLDTGDDDVDFLVVNHTGTGALTVGLSSLATIDADDVITFNGSTDATDTIIISGNVDLSDDTLVSVDAIVLNNTISGTGNNAVLTLSQAQLDDIGVSNITAQDAVLPTNNTATLNLVEFGSDPFDATAVTPQVSIGSITIQAGNITLDPSTDLTNVGQIIVPEGSTLNLTAAQFNQLAGNGTIIGLDVDGVGGIGEFFVNITDLTQADIANDLNGDGDSNDTGELFSLADIGSQATVTLSLAQDVNLAADTDLGDLDHLTVNLSAGQTLGLANVGQADGLNVEGPAATLVYQFSGLPVAGGPFIDPDGQIDASGYNVAVLKALASSFNTSNSTGNVEYVIDDLRSSVELRLYEDPTDLGYFDPTFRKVVIETGITTPTGLVFNDWDDGDEVRTLDLTLEGDVTLNGALRIPARADNTGPEGQTRHYFETLTIHSEGAEVNTIDGNITAVQPFIPGNQQNNLLDIVIDAQQDLVITGAGTNSGNIVFAYNPDSNWPSALAGKANLTVSGPAEVTVDALDVTDADITVLNVNVDDATLTLTGSSPAINGSTSLEEINFSGDGDVIIGDHDLDTTPWGITAPNLSNIDASSHSGLLDLGEIRNIDNRDFTFTSGTGTAKVTLNGDSLDADNVVAEGNDLNAKWTFDFSTAGADSEFHLGANIYGNAPDLAANDRSNALDIKLGANTTLYIDADTDFTNLESLTISQVKDIVLADGVTLTLTAAQANGLKIIAGEDTDLPGFTGVVNIVGLDNDQVYDFSDIIPAGTITLAEDDVTVEAGTDLGTFSITLEELDEPRADSLAGQTIRFSTEAQATREIIVDEVLTDNNNSSTNVAWLFTSISDPNGIDTSKYDTALGRLWLNEALINNEGGDIENLFTTLPNSILRVDFADLATLNALLSSQAVDRVVEFVHFTNLGNLSFSDVGATPDEFIQTLDLRLGGEVNIGNIAIDDVIGGANVDPDSVHFDGLTLNSYRAVRTGDLLAAHGETAADDFVNNNDGVNEFKDDINPIYPHEGENAQPDNINTVGNISVGGNNSVDLTVVNINTHGVTVIGDGSGQNGAALQTGKITYDSEVAGDTGHLNVQGDNDVTIAAVDHSDAQFTAFTLNTAGFTATLSAPGASPAIDLGTNTLVQNTESFTILGGTSESVITISADQVDNNNEFIHIFYTLDGVAVDPPLTVNLTGIDVTDAAAVATAVAADLNGISGISAVPNGAEITVTPDAGHSFLTTGISTSGTQETLDGTFSNGTTINLGSASHAGVVGDDLSLIDASGYAGALNLGIVALIDGTEDDEQDFNGDGDKVDANEAANRAFTFIAGTGVTTMTLGKDPESAKVPTLAADNEWYFDYSTAALGSRLTLTDEVVFQPPANPGDLLPKLILLNVDLYIQGDVDLTGVDLSGIDSASDIFVPAGNSLTLTVDQVEELAGGVRISGEGTVYIEGDASSLVPLDQLSLWQHVRVVNVDLSGVTISTDPLVDADSQLRVDLHDNGAIDDNGDPVGYNVLGSAFDDYIEASDLDDTINGALGDDTLEGKDGSDTFLVTSGTDTIVDLVGEADDMNPATTEENDVLVVSSGATAVGRTTGFIATAATANNGTAILNTTAADATIDVSAATGANGFTLLGGTGDLDGLNGIDGDETPDGNEHLIGSSKADIINGGNSLQDAATKVDTLTGNGGADTFVFDISRSTPIALGASVSVTPGDDNESWTITSAFAANDLPGQLLTVVYRNGATVGNFQILDDATIDFTSVDELGARIATELSTRGVSSTYDVLTDKVLVNGTAGSATTAAQSVEILSMTPSVVGFAASEDALFDLTNDQGQVNTVTVGTGGAQTAIAGEIYKMIVTTAEGNPYSAEFIAAGGETEQQISDGLVASFNTSYSVISGIIASNGAGTTRTITLSDTLLPILSADDGGFTVSLSASAGINGTGASSLGAGSGVWANAFADVITDFTPGQDVIKLGIAAGTPSNYKEDTVVETSYNAAWNAAEAKFTGDAAVRYFLTSIDGSTLGEHATGLLFFDANGDQHVDGVIELTGINPANFSEAAIIL